MSLYKSAKGRPSIKLYDLRGLSQSLSWWAKQRFSDLPQKETQRMTEDEVCNVHRAPGTAPGTSTVSKAPSSILFPTSPSQPKAILPKEPGDPATAHVRRMRSLWPHTATDLKPTLSPLPSPNTTLSLMNKALGMAHQNWAPS